MCNNYFVRPTQLIYSKREQAILTRKHHKNSIPGLPKIKIISVGDTLEVPFYRFTVRSSFKGIRISISKRGLVRPDTSFILRNVYLM
jgi:hypothetical protein